jgi:uncharacterized protein (DUF2235 family)
VNLCIFFEGTGQGVAGNFTNVTRMRDICLKDEKQLLHLVPGPGTRFGMYLRGRLMGADWWAASRNAKSWFNKKYRQNNAEAQKYKIFLFGFSRGALIARHFAAWLEEKKVKVHYLGLWDTVDSTIGLDVPETAPSNILNVRHAVARDEERRFFQHVPIKGGKKTKVLEILFPGSHSDVGGLYEDNHIIADLTLSWIAAGAKRAGLRLVKGVKIQEEIDKSKVVLHDSHDEANNLWGVFDRVKRVLGKLKLHKACEGL